MNDTTYDRIITMLNEAGAGYRAIEHEETRTSEESARARGEELRVGGKALLVKADSGFHLAVLSADRKLDSRALQRCLSSRKLRFATAEELAEMTSLTPGSVPPFGRPILPFALIVDRSVLRNERIAFNAGSLRKSIIMITADYVSLSGGSLADFSKE
jgi:Ala-tRNA(Pro) deacylase